MMTLPATPAAKAPGCTTRSSRPTDQANNEGLRLSREEQDEFAVRSHERAVELLDETGDPGAITLRSIAVWVGLHGLAHQRLSAPSFPWPPDIAGRIIAGLARFTSE
jgi:hypothetical protein